MKTYIEITAIKDDKVVKRMDVTWMGERARERIERDILINLNRDEYYVATNQSETELPIF